MQMATILNIASLQKNLQRSVVQMLYEDTVKLLKYADEMTNLTKGMYERLYLERNHIICHKLHPTFIFKEVNSIEIPVTYQENAKTCKMQNNKASPKFFHCEEQDTVTLLDSACLILYISCHWEQLMVISHSPRTLRRESTRDRSGTTHRMNVVIFCNHFLKNTSNFKNVSSFYNVSLQEIIFDHEFSLISG